MLRNERGQMAIFVALFFQVLFVFFAMAINVGLVVHDKINLQNAVDLAAYYGAMKQAEVLNEIAHINYQMRQNYKLFVWRYRVLSTLGNNNHPLSPLNAPQLYEETDSGAAGVAPVVCVGHSFFQEGKDIDSAGSNLCKDNANYVQNVTPPGAVTGIVPGAGALPAVIQTINAQIGKFCKQVSVFNWLWAGRVLLAYRVDGFVRKQMIQKLAQNLALPDPKDARNDSIREGVEKTLRRNLTDSNEGNLQFDYYNSLSAEECNDMEDWLPEIRINPVIYFSEHEVVGAENDCATPKNLGNRNELPSAFGDAAFAPVLDSNNTLAQHWQGEPDGDLHSSMGFEKNPWCMVYSGVQATTTVRKPFAPLGAVTLTARGYAKPFGGRIGPWYGKSWPRGSGNSQASSRDISQMTDALLPSRDVAGDSGGSFDYNDDVANYSRYPGDTLGLSSMAALSAMGAAFRNAMQFTNFSTGTPPVAFANYNNLGRLTPLLESGDSLARDGVVTRTDGSQVTVTDRLRQFELAAVAPDVFDALYYSVEPKFHTNYIGIMNGGPFEGDEAIFDFGSTIDNYKDLAPSLDVMNQVTVAQSLYYQTYKYYLRDWRHLLTGWHQNDVNDFSLDPNRFARCSSAIENQQFPTSGNCVVGGRTGYSVKLISNEYLNSSNHQLGGGSGGDAGAILNPPSF